MSALPPKAGRCCMVPGEKLPRRNVRECAISRHRTNLMRRQSHAGMKHSPEDGALFALGPEQLLAVNLVIGDCLLAFVRNEPLDELLAKLLLHMWMLGRVNQHDTVLVEKQLIALHCDDEVAPVLERKPRAAVRHHIGSAVCCYVERRTHALPDRFVPRPSFFLVFIPDFFPEFDFGIWRAGVLAPGIEGCPLTFMVCSAKRTFLDPLMPAGSSFGPMMTKSLYITE